MRKIVKEVIEGFKDAIAHAQGEKDRGVLTTYTVPNVDVKSIRKKTGMSREEFCEVFAIKPRTLDDWEQKRISPVGPSRILLALFDQEPLTLNKVLKTLGHPVKNQIKKKSPKRQSGTSLLRSKKVNDPKPVNHKLRKKV